MPPRHLRCDRDTRCARSGCALMTLGRALGPFAPALSLTVVASGCGGRESTTSVEEGAIPVTTESVYLATALACRNLGSEDARFTPLVVRGPDYATTIEPIDDCRKQS